MDESTLADYAEHLQSCLQWDPVNGADGQQKQEFVEALTQIAALPLDSISMEIRHLLVSDAVHVRNVVAALNARDVQLKCKAANTVGSLCISRVAGQQLLGLFGPQILASVAKMATRKNQWVQGDAFYLLGWMVVIADEEMLQTIAELLPTVVKYLHRNLKLPLESEEQNKTKAALASSEQASNFRVYALVLLLNFSQRHVDVFAEELDQLLPMLRDLVQKLHGPATEESPTASIFFDASEYGEVLRLAITLLSVLVDQLDTVAPQLLELKVLPDLLKLKQTLDTTQVHELIDAAGIQDITERLEAAIETLLHCR
ncbi:hypothetical protein PHMEG_0007873 [Phytophthora megakarya]|uniref:Uncharacterized protein n=1 Tax=Phytophthora megakarya TaxID=4795 RepID=A0A225WK34_9STRA|nr:hypothetical protein PHMEG_0007873 [Phytophthora megakarya]